LALLARLVAMALGASGQRALECILQVGHRSILISKTSASPSVGAGGSGRLGRRPIASSAPAPIASTSGQPISVVLPPAATIVVATSTATPIQPGPGARSTAENAHRPKPHA